jgi:hypothetical protein
MGMVRTTMGMVGTTMGMVRTTMEWAILTPVMLPFAACESL